MLRRTLLVILMLALCAPAIAQKQDAAKKQPFPKPIDKLELKDGDSIVFLGDSITHQCLYTQYVEDYFYTRYPKMRLKFHNAGVGGARAWDALARFDKDVAKYKAKYVTILLGMNDGTYRPFHDPTFDIYKKDMKEVLSKIVSSGSQPILMTPTMFDSRAARLRRPNAKGPRLEFYNSVLAYYGTWLREVAAESGYGFVDMYSRLNNITFRQRKKDPSFTLIRDAVHPDAPGQLVMAFSILEDMKMPRLVSSIRIVKRGQQWRPQARRGELTELDTVEGGGISFTWQAESLPFAVPQEAQLGAQLVGLGNRMSRETLEVNGLRPGTYQLLIDGKSIGVYNHVALAKTVPLHNKRNTPQYQQALAVAELNKKRNNEAVRKLRNEWSRFQGFARWERRAKANPNDKNAAGQLANAKKRIEGMAARVTKHEAAAKAIEDEIFKINQPKSHKYVLKRVRLELSAGTVKLKGKPLAGAQVVISGLGIRRVMKTNDEGEFKLPRWRGLLPGSYQVTVRVKGKTVSPAGLKVSVTEDGDNEFDFDLK